MPDAADAAGVPATYRRRRVLPAVLLALFAGLCLGFFAGRSTGPATFDLTGRPYATHEQASVRVDGWSYGIPLDVAWISADGAHHEGGRPDCLPPRGELGPVHFGAVEVKRDQVTWRQVVWVDCSG